MLTIFGFRLQLLVRVEGLILDCELTPANASDLSVGVELLADHTDLTVYGDFRLFNRFHKIRSYAVRRD